MGLIGGMARTAVVAGTATAVSNRVSRRQANRWAEQEQQQAYEQQPAYAQPQAYAPPPPPQYQQPVYQAPAPPPEPAGEDVDTQLAQLRQLAQLKDQGVLTEEEFAAQKAKILNS